MRSISSRSGPPLLLGFGLLGLGVLGTLRGREGEELPLESEPPTHDGRLGLSYDGRPEPVDDCPPNLAAH